MTSPTDNHTVLDVRISEEPQREAPLHPATVGVHVDIGSDRPPWAVLELAGSTEVNLSEDDLIHLIAQGARVLAQLRAHERATALSLAADEADKLDEEGRTA